MSNHVKNRMPLVQLGQPGWDGVKGVHVDCDYCEGDAGWYHFASSRDTDRHYYACDAHVSLLNPFYG